MAVKNSIFGSKGEERGFRSIEHTWGEKYRLSAQFPWAQIFTLDSRWQGTTDFFYKTSVDYLLATPEGQPLMAIDFDGLGGGFDYDGKYVQVEPTPKDPYRKEKLDIKLRYARQHDFPYHIVAGEEFNQFGDGIELTVVDGIIGSAIAEKHFWEQVQSRTFTNENDLIALELACEIEHNPILRRRFEVMDQICAITGEDHAFYLREQCHTTESELPPVGRHICITTLKNTPVGEVSDVVAVRTSNGSYLGSEIALLLVYSKLLRLITRKA